MTASAFAFFGRIHGIRMRADDTAWNLLKTRLEHFGVAGRTTSSQLDAGVVDGQARLAVAQRRPIEDAVASGVQRLLMLEDGCLLLADAPALLAPVIAELDGQDWSTLHLGAITWGREAQPWGTSRHLVSDSHFSGTYAVAYNRPAMIRLLAEMPADIPHLGDWVHRHRSYDSYLTTLPGRVLCRNRVATLPAQLIYEDPASRDRFLAGA